MYLRNFLFVLYRFLLHSFLIECIIGIQPSPSIFILRRGTALSLDKISEIDAFASRLARLLLCAGHGTNSVGDSPTTGSYRQV